VNESIEGLSGLNISIRVTPPPHLRLPAYLRFSFCLGGWLEVSEVQKAYLAASLRLLKFRKLAWEFVEGFRKPERMSGGFLKVSGSRKECLADF
jgi:hypothetical protein